MEVGKDVCVAKVIEQRWLKCKLVHCGNQYGKDSKKKKPKRELEYDLLYM